MQEVAALLEEGYYDMKQFLDGGWVTSLKYEDEVIADLKERTVPGSKPEEVRLPHITPPDVINKNKYLDLRYALGLPYALI